MNPGTSVPLHGLLHFMQQKHHMTFRKIKSGDLIQRTILKHVYMYVYLCHTDSDLYVIDQTGNPKWHGKMLCLDLLYDFNLSCFKKV